MMSGVLNVRKEKGITSFGVIARLRKILGVKKAGHTGTLDPDATGVLVVCVGSATKLCGTLTGCDKVYRTVMLLGKETDTQDVSGTVLSEHEVQCTEPEVRRAVLSFQGQIVQVPPMYSALKVNGRKLVDLARRGESVERRGRAVTIYEIRIDKIDLPRVTMTVHCSRGTYIRTLCSDIGRKLGCGACMESLERIRTGEFSIRESHTISEIEEACRAGRPDEFLIPTDFFFRDAPKAGVISEDQIPLKNGNPFPLRDVYLIREEAQATVESDHPVVRDQSPHLPDPDGQRTENTFLSALPEDELPPEIRIYTQDGTFAAVYSYRQDRGLYWPEKMFL